MIGVIRQERHLNGVGHGADATEVRHFSDFDALIKWTTPITEEGWSVVLSEDDRGRFVAGEEITLYESDNGASVFIISVSFLESPSVPNGYYYMSGGDGSVIGLPCGTYIDTVWGQGYWDVNPDAPIHRDSAGEFLEELHHIINQVNPPISRDADAKALEAAFACVSWATYEDAQGYTLPGFLTDDGSVDMEKCIEVYVGGSIDV